MPRTASPIINFPAILASSIHDIKNSLTHIRELIKQLAKLHSNAENSEFQLLEIEADRMNRSSIKLILRYSSRSSTNTLPWKYSPMWQTSKKAYWR